MDTSDNNVKKKVTLTFMQAKLQSALNSDKTDSAASIIGDEDEIKSDAERSLSPPASTDHFLTIVPKPTLLGKQQAKKRLLAFSNLKQNQHSPAKKLKANVINTIEVTEKFNEDGHKVEEITVVKKPPKKNVNHDEKAKEIIEEIESIKKYETTLLEQIKGDRRYDRRNKGRKKDDLKRFDYPKTWYEVVHRCISPDTIRDLNRLQYGSFSKKKPMDALRMLRFHRPSDAYPSLQCKLQNGQHKQIPPQHIRFTSASPKISYSVNYTRIKDSFFTRKQVLSNTSKVNKEIIQSIIAQAEQEKPILPTIPIKIRQWYNKTILNQSETNCELLEPSLGLAILQNYLDDDENHEHNVEVKIKKKSEKKKNKKDKKSKKRKKKKSKKKKRSKSAHSETSKSDKKMQVKQQKAEETIEGNGYISPYFNDFQLDDDRPIKSYKNKKSSNNNANNNDIFPIIENSINLNDNLINEHIDDNNQFLNNIDLPNNNDPNDTKLATMETKLTNDEKTSPLINSSIDELKIKCESDTGTPNTDEYHSHWESDDEELQQMHRKKQNVWESDEEIRNDIKQEIVTEPAKVVEKMTERCLEMPLNITFTRLRCRNEDDCDEAEETVKEADMLRKKNDKEVVELEKQRRLLTHERELLEKEKREIAELERRITMVEEKQLFQLENCDASGDKKLRKSRWQQDAEKKIKEEQPAATLNNATLENEYEQFMKAVGVNDDEECLEGADKHKRSYSSSSSSSDSSTTTTSSSDDEDDSSTSESDTSNKLANEGTINSPICKVDSTSSPSKTTVDNCMYKLDLENRKPINSIVLNKKPSQLLDNSLFRESGESDNEEKEKKTETQVTQQKPDKAASATSSSSSSNEHRPRAKKKLPDANSKAHKSKEYKRKEYGRRKYNSPKRKRRLSPPLPPARKKRMQSPQSSSSRRRYRDSPPRHRYSPQRRARDSSPRYHSPRRKRSLSPYQRKKRSASKDRKTESIQETLHRIAGIEYEKAKSPPVEGFIRSIADSTISDDQLLQNQEEYMESPYYNPQQQQQQQYNKDITSSPKRIPLDDRINQVLGIDKEEPRQICTTYGQQSYAQEYNHYYDQYYLDYDNKHYKDYRNKREIKDVPMVQSNQVLQVGNVLQVVPTDDFYHKIDSVVSNVGVVAAAPVAVTASGDSSQKIVQVGNMLQIVPTATLPTAPVLSAATLIEPLSDFTTINCKEKQSAEDLMKVKIAERKAEREKRRLERERRRKDKEKKRKEREKRRQMKIKLKTEEMIKKALLIDTEANNDEDECDVNDKLIVPSIIISNDCNKMMGKGILITHDKRLEQEERPKKGVKFADGIIPGEGTSPSAGEELSSPPPISVKLPKEKRYTKTKKPKKQPKKKVKVKIVKKPNRISPLEDDVDEENLPPPSPPPGSPPPYIFPPRYKPSHMMNNYLPPPSPYPYNTAPPAGPYPPYVAPPPSTNASSSNPHLHHHHHHSPAQAIHHQFHPVLPPPPPSNPSLHRTLQTKPSSM